MTAAYSIPLSGPDVTQREIDAVLAVLATPQLSLGPRLPEFEKRIAAFTGAKHALAVNSGTSGLHLCIRALGIADGDEVITTPFSFIASANCALFERAKPVFVDIDPVTLNIDPAKIETAITPRTKAILPVDVFGLPADMKRICAIAEKHGLAVIEDSCEALGASIDGRQAGRWGDCGVFGFYPNKQMTTGEGGAIITDRDDIAALCASMRNQGRDDGMGWLAHARLGYNYRLSDINCALGIAQLERMDGILAARAQVAAWYAAELAALAPHVIRPPEPPAGVVRSWFVYVIQLPGGYTAEQRNALITHLRGRGIGCSHYFPCIHLQPLYAKSFGYARGDFPVTEGISDRTMALPFFNRLTQPQVNTVVRELAAWLAANTPGGRA
ncbi:DegT/DnrJ/EryC1/StrS family aminotransferase [bacterium]|nr:DegT/DnrJ/EryC1/StrS family aminotransferase [bacterium]